MGNKFVHLKLHTEYSLLEGVGKIDEYVEKAKEIGAKALAITDTSMFGAIEFFKKCKNAEIKPIIGLEVSFRLLYLLKIRMGIKIYQNCRQFHIADLHGIGIKLSMMN